MSEREQIVRWLNARAAKYDKLLLPWLGTIIRGLAYLIEAGQHLKEESDAD